MASYAAEAAALQGKFWEMHNKIYETQNAWSNLDNPKTPSRLRSGDWT